jgi:peptidoglycan/LPS O-acetylase OafA/YrhL
MEKSNGKERVFGLDALRSVAILMVLCPHLFLIYPNGNVLASQIVALFGFWGVEVFFVLSGFLIGRILFELYMQDDFTIDSIIYFLKRRWFRTLPNYFLVLVLNLVITFVLSIEVNRSVLYFFFLQNFSTTMLPFFPESWSLSVLQYGYLLMPFSLLFISLLIRPKSKSKRFIWVVLVLVFFFLGSKAYYNFTTENVTIDEWNVSLKGVVVYRIDAILIGVIASWLSLNYAVLWKQQKNKIAFFGGLLIVFMFVGVGYFRILIDTHPFFWNVLYLPLTSIAFALFLPFLAQLQSPANWLSKAVTFLSLISYSIYLLHYGVVLQLMKYVIDTSYFSVIQLHLFTFCYLGIIFFGSYLLYNYFEKPIMDLRDQMKNH